MSSAFFNLETMEKSNKTKNFFVKGGFGNRNISEKPENLDVSDDGTRVTGTAEPGSTVTVKDELKLSKKDRNSFFTDQKIEEWLDKLGLANHLNQVVYTLSGGQQKKLQILLLLMTKHDVLLIDEPLSGLDHKSVKLVLNLMRESQERLQQTFLIISHQIDELADFCSYRLVFEQQQLKYVEK